MLFVGITIHFSGKIRGMLQYDTFACYVDACINLKYQGLNVRSCKCCRLIDESAFAHFLESPFFEIAGSVPGRYWDGERAIA